MNAGSSPLGFVSNEQFLVDNYAFAQIAGERVSSKPQLLVDMYYKDVPTATDRGMMFGVTPKDGGLSWCLGQADALKIKRLCEWSPPPGRLLNKVSLHTAASDGHTLVTVDVAPGTPAIIRAWHRGDDATPPVEVASFSVDSGYSPLYQFALTSDGQRIAVAANSGLSLWSLENDKPTQLWHKDGYCHAVAISPDGHQLAASFSTGNQNLPHVTLFNELGEPQSQWDFPGAPTDLAFAPDGRHLLTANPNGTVYVLRLSPPK